MTRPIRDRKLAANFWLSEFLRSDEARRRGLDNRPSEAEILNIARTARHLQAERDFLSLELGVPVRVIITSGFRCEALNDAVGGSSTSDHRTGLAADTQYERTDTGAALAPISVIRMLGETDLAFDQRIFYPGQSRIHAGYGSAMRRQVLTKTADGYRAGLVTPR